MYGMAERLEILWIEDSARYELSDLLGPVYHNRNLRLTLAEDAALAMDYLINQKFDLFIFDIRLPPGGDDLLSNLYNEAKKGDASSHLGLRIMEWLLSKNGYVHEKITAIPPKINPNQIAVFTVESLTQIGDRLSSLGIDTYVQKTTVLPDTILLDIINMVISKIESVS